MPAYIGCAIRQHIVLPRNFIRMLHRTTLTICFQSDLLTEERTLNHYRHFVLSPLSLPSSLHIFRMTIPCCAPFAEALSNHQTVALYNFCREHIRTSYVHGKTHCRSLSSVTFRGFFFHTPHKTLPFRFPYLHLSFFASVFRFLTYYVSQYNRAVDESQYFLSKFI